MSFKGTEEFGIPIANTVDKFGDNAVDKIKNKSSDEYVSPYLQRPLRSFADVLADRAPYRMETDERRSTTTAFDRDPIAVARQRRQH